MEKCEHDGNRSGSDINNKVGSDEVNDDVYRCKELCIGEDGETRLTVFAITSVVQSLRNT